MDYELNELLTKAILSDATDIHFSIGAVTSLFFRKGKTYLGSAYSTCAEQLLNYVIFISGCDSLPKMVPKSGVFEFVHKEETIYCRVAYIESSLVRSCVIRLHTSIRQFDEALTPDVIDMIEASQLSGLLLLCGPTGSGKTTHLYQICYHYSDFVLYSIEAPVEIVSQKWLQLETKPAIGADLGSLVTALLRHNPDIIVIGELRSQQDVSECVRASLSGHLILATIHAQTPIEVIERLQDLGCSAHELSIILKGMVMHQGYSNAHQKYAKYVVTQAEIETLLKLNYNTVKCRVGD